MKRFLSARSLFRGAGFHLAPFVYREVWSPVLLPSPEQVGLYLKGAAEDGTLWQAIVITMRRLLLGYLIGLLWRITARTSDGALENFA